jgi:predicted DNA-binding protein YlxM (UPF0122 family)
VGVKKHISKELIVELYFNRRMTLQEVCDATDIKSPITLRKRLKEYGLEARDVNEENSLVHRLGITKEEFKSNLIDLYIIKEMSINEIAKNFNVTQTIIRRRMKEFGIEFRDAEVARKMYSGEKHHSWKGGRRKHDGYVQIKKPNHPNADSCGYVYEHRYLIEQKIGRRLKTEEHVHHVNGIKNDNRLENLQLMTNIDHIKLHAKLRKERKTS